MSLIQSFSYNPKPILFAPSGEKKWKITSPVKCILEIESMGKLIYNIKSGYETNFRSGPDWLDPIIPNIEDSDIQICWLIHDINYDVCIDSKDEADQILLSMLRKTRLASLLAIITKITVDIGGGGNYNPNSDNQYITITRVKNSGEQTILNSLKPVISLMIDELIENIPHSLDLTDLIKEIKTLSKKFNLNIDIEEFEKKYFEKQAK
ncbi:MAG: hypothetical protein JRJ49_07515 [Deltaproteobacteria bacterium]|nr:hypothetical protein [Deltaproteobacteria bacterium]